jgi:hypothetical protein
MRETTLILLFYIDRFSQAKKLMFQNPLSDNFNETIFDLLLVSSVTRVTYKQMGNLTEDENNDINEFSQKTLLRIRLADYFSLIKKNLYSLVEQNLKHTFVSLFNVSKIPSNIIDRTTLMIKLLSIIPRDLRIYIREGVIFNKIKIVKSLWRKACKSAPNYSKYHLSPKSEKLGQYSELFLHLPMIVNTITRFSQKQGIPLTDEKVMSCLEVLLGKSSTLIMISSLETIFQCQLANDFLGNKNIEPGSKTNGYNYTINLKNLSSESTVEDVIKLRKENLSYEKNVNEITNKEDVDVDVDVETERIKELYIKQITRTLRLFYFITLKCQEQQLYQLLNLKDISTEDLMHVHIKLYCVCMRLSAFDDIDNYNNIMKTALSMLTSIMKYNKEIAEPEVHNLLLSVFKNHYRSDMIHRRTKPILANLISLMNSSNMPEHVKQEFVAAIDNNLKGKQK